MSSQLVNYDVLTDTATPAGGWVRLAGDGWYIEISRHDERSILVRSAGSIVGADRLSVMPHSSNAVVITTRAEEEKRAFELAERVIATDASNKEFWATKGKRK